MLFLAPLTLLALQGELGSSEADDVSPLVTLRMTERAPSPESLQDPIVKRDWPPERLAKADALELEGHRASRDEVQATLRRLRSSLGHTEVAVSVARSRPWSEAADLVEFLLTPSHGVRTLRLWLGELPPADAAPRVEIRLTEASPTKEALEDPAIAAEWPRSRQKLADSITLEGKRMSSNKELRARLGVRAKTQKSATRLVIVYAESRKAREVLELVALVGEPALNVDDIVITQGGFDADASEPNATPATETAPATKAPTMRLTGALGRSIHQGMEWLIDEQQGDGSWPGGDSEDTSIGVTGLAILALLGGFDDPIEAKRAKAVQRGVEYLLGQQDEDDGCFGSRTAHHFMYNHLYALKAVLSFAISTGSTRPLKQAEFGVEFTEGARNAYAAWRYDYPPVGNNDVSISALALESLALAKAVGIRIDDEAIQDGMNFVIEMRDPKTGRIGYTETGSIPGREPEALEEWPGELSESCTAFGLLALLSHGARTADPLVRESLALLDRRPPVDIREFDGDPSQVDLLYWYCGTRVLRLVGGRDWRTWRRAAEKAVQALQETQGEETGSWDPSVDPWGDQGGRTYATAVGILTLRECGSFTPPALGVKASR